MGGNRKGKGQQSYQNRKTSSSNNLQQLDNDDDVFSQEWEDETPSPTSIFSSWKEVAVAGMVLIGLGLLSVIVGVAAGMTISIHYFEDPVHRVDRNGMVINSPHRSTTYDSDMVARNVMTATPSLDLGRIVKNTFKGERTVVSVVQEGTPVDAEKVTSDGDAFRDIFFTQPSITPSLCSDGITMGFSDWSTLKAAVREGNALSAEKFLRWNEYFSSIEPHEFGAFADDALYYEDEFIFVICPDITLKARRGPIFINAENVIVQCDGCTVDVGGTHFSFGPHARNAFIRGITFKGMHGSSQAFHYDGADATFEECLWIHNSGKSKFGPVADVNSTR